MRIQHIVMALLVFLACMTALSNIAVDLENGWGVTDESLMNNTGNVSSIIDAFNYNKFTETHQLTVNATQYAPSGSTADTPDTSQAGSTASSFMMAYHFAAMLWTLPGLIIGNMGTFFGIDPIWLTTLTLWIVITVAFIIASAVFYNKL